MNVQFPSMGYTGRGFGLQAPKGSPARAIEDNLATLESSDFYRKSDYGRQLQMKANISKGLPALADPKSFVPSSAKDPISGQPSYWALKGSGFSTEAKTAQGAMNIARMDAQQGGGSGGGAVYSYAPQQPRQPKLPKAPTIGPQPSQGMTPVSNGLSGTPFADRTEYPVLGGGVRSGGSPQTLAGSLTGFGGIPRFPVREESFLSRTR